MSDEIPSIGSVEYRQLAHEFDLLWACGPSDANRRRMDYIVCVISAFEESLGKPSLS